MERRSHRRFENNVVLSPPLRTIALVCLVIALSYLASKLGSALVLGPQVLSPLWPGCALLVAVLLLVRKKNWPILIAASFATFVLQDLHLGVPIRSIIWMILADTAEVLIAAFGLRYAFGSFPRLDSLRNLAKYSFFAVILAPVIGAFIGAFAFRDSYWTNWRIGCFSEALAYLTFLPAILGWIDKGSAGSQKSRANYVESAALLAVLVLMGYLDFVSPGRSSRPALLYSLVPILLWAALRFGSTGVSTSMIVIAFLSIWGTTLGQSPFARLAPLDSVLSLQLFLFFAAASFMVLASIVEESKQAQASLSRKERQLIEAQRLAEVGNWQWDPATDAVTWSEEIYRMAGYDPALPPPSFKSHDRFFTPESWEQLNQSVERAMRTGVPYQLDLEAVHSDGTELWVTSRGEAVCDASGHPAYLRGTIQNITARKRADEARLRHAAIVESSEDAIISKDLNGSILSWNAAAQRIFGFTEEEAVGQPITIIVPPDLRDEENKILERLRKGERLEHYETTRCTKEGKRVDVSLTMSPVRDSTGEVVGASKIARDITDRKRAEQELRESEERFRLVANTAPTLIWMSGTDKLCTFFNKGWLDFTGQTMEHELGEGWAAGVHPEDLERCLKVYTAAFDARVDFQMEYRLRRFDGKYRWIVDYGVPRFESDGTFCGYIGSCVDFTDRKLAEESLEELSGRLITAQEVERARIARELHDDFSQRMALQGIGLRQLWKKLPESEVEAREKVQELLKETQELSSDMHSLSHELHSSRLEHVGLVPALIGLCEEMSSKYNITVEFTERGPFDAIPKDVALCLFRVAQEALSNVVKHSRAKQAQVGLTGVNDEIRLRIMDSGVGFDSDLPSSRAGIGLVGMRERLRLVGGTLSVRSAPMRGTEILAQVPLSASTSRERVRVASFGE
jgi:PAS domain S-box-containing protein